MRVGERQFGAAMRSHRLFEFSVIVFFVASPPTREGRGEAMWSCDAVKNLDEREYMSGQSFHSARARPPPSPIGILTELEVRLPDSGGAWHSHYSLRTSILGVALAGIQVRALSGSAGASPSQKTC